MYKYIFLISAKNGSWPANDDDDDEDDDDNQRTKGTEQIDNIENMHDLKKKIKIKTKK